MPRPFYSSRFRAPRQSSQDTKKKLNRNILLVAILAALVIALVLNYKGSLDLGKRFKSPLIKIVDSSDLEHVILDELAHLGIREEWIHSRRGQEGETEGGIIKVRVPQDISLTLCNLRIHQLMEKAGGIVRQATEEVRENQIRMHLSCPPGLSQSVLLKRDNTIERGAVKIALLVDLAGNPPEQIITELSKVHQCLTLCIRPGSESAGEMARLARDQGYEIILQLPVAAGTAAEPPEYALDSVMSQAQVEDRIGEGLAEIAQARGICPTLAAESIDQTLLAKVMNAAQKKSLYYIDTSNLPPASMEQAAVKAGVKMGKTQLHLGSQKGTGHVKEQLERLSGLAMKTGQALAMGQFCPETVTALREYIPVIEGRGIELVFASELVQ